MSVIDSMASSFKNLKNKIAGGVKYLTLDLLGTSSNLYRPAIEELFKEMEFISDWIQESSGSPPSGGKPDKDLCFKLAQISKFINDCVLGVVLGDLSVLIEHY